MKKTVNIMDYCNKLFAADLFAGIVLEEDFDTGCNYTWSAAGDDWADKFRAELNSPPDAVQSVPPTTAKPLLSSTRWSRPQQSRATPPPLPTIPHSLIPSAPNSTPATIAAHGVRPSRCTLSTCWTMCRRVRTIWSACPLTVQSLSGGRSTVQEYRQIEPTLAHDAVVTFTAANGCTVRQDAVRNWYVYTDSAHAPKKYSYLASALKYAAVGGCKL